MQCETPIYTITHDDNGNSYLEINREALAEYNRLHPSHCPAGISSKDVKPMPTGGIQLENYL